jgi:anti-sigma B factor antagonist
VTASSIDRHSTSDESHSSDVLDLGLVTLVVSGPPALPRLAARGEVDCTTAPAFQERAEQLLDAGAREVTLDLTEVTFLDSAGLCALALLHRRATAGSIGLRVLAATRAVIRPMEITGLWHLLGGQRVDSIAS